MRLNDAELAEIMSRGGRQASKSKYRNVKVGGYDSKKEAKRAQHLKYEQHAGIIAELEEQVRYELVPKQAGMRAVSYVADFRYKRDGVEVVEDVKSVITAKNPTYIIKKKLMLWVHGIQVFET